MPTNVPDNRRAAKIARELKGPGMTYNVHAGGLKEQRRCRNFDDCGGSWPSTDQFARVALKHERRCNRSTKAERLAWRSSGQSDYGQARKWPR